MNNKINEECIDIYLKKLELNSKINSLLLKQKKYDYELIDLKYEEGEILKELNIYVAKLMTYLWNEPKLVVNLLNTADKNDIKENLAPLITNNFYENILSSNYIEDNLLYVMTLLLQEEINNLKDENDYLYFLNESPCGFLMEELKEKKDIQTFFKMIIIKAVEKLESSCSNKKLFFSLGQIQEELEKKENINKKNDNISFFMRLTSKKSDIVRNSFNKIESNENEEKECELDKSKSFLFEQKPFKEKYFQNFTKEKILTEKENLKSGNKIESDIIDEVFKIYLEKIDSNENKEKSNNGEKCMIDTNHKYESKDFLYDLEKDDEKIKRTYMNNFNVSLEIINLIFSNMEDNLYLIPYSVKCLCKIILTLIKKKFPNINLLQQNAYMGRFFFGKLFLPFFLAPTYEALITNFLISKNTFNNLKILSRILLNLIYGELYENNFETKEFTPFNLFFIEKMPELIKIINELQKVKLPNFIEKLLNDELPKDFKLDYFNENPDEFIYHRSICFNIDDVGAIIKTIGLNKELYFNETNNKGLKKTYEKLCTNNSKLIMKDVDKKQNLKRNLSLKDRNKIKEKIDKTKTDNNKSLILPKMYYFLMSDIKINEKYKNAFKLEETDQSFRLEELKELNNETDITKNNVIRVKNSICSILYNYQYLNKNDFPEGTTNNTKIIFTEIKKSTKSNNYIINDSIPTQWFLNSLFENLEKIPQNYIDNDYELLLNEIEKDIKESIEMLNFDIIYDIHEKLNYSNRLKNNYEKKKRKIKKVKLNDKINNIIERDPIPVAIYFDYSKKFLKIEKANINVKQLQLMDDLVIEDTKKKCIICKTIKIFTNEFPNLTKYQIWQDIDLFEFEKNLSLPGRLEEYLDIIKEYLQKNKIVNENNLDIINDKIYDYILGKLYDKIFPKEDQMDDKIFRQTILLSWIEPKHFILDKKNYIFDGFLPDVNNYLKKLENQKSPRKKFSNMSKIFELIRNLVKFNGDDIMAGVDDQMPILNYTLIKARPLRIYSNCKFMELFLGDKKNKKEDSELIQLLSLCDYICNMSNSKLINVSKEEYQQKCNEAANNDNSYNSENF